MLSIAYQRFSINPSLLIEHTAHLPSWEFQSKKRVQAYKQQVIELIYTQSWVKRRNYTKKDQWNPLHTKYELDIKENSISKEGFLACTSPEVTALLIPICTWTDTALQKRFELIARLYTGENLWVVLLAIRVLLDDDIHWVEYDFRESLKMYDQGKLWSMLIEWSRDLPDGSKYHDNKLAKNPASSWGTDRPNNFVMSEVDRIIRLKQGSL